MMNTSIPNLISDSAARYGLDLSQFKALIYSESGAQNLPARNVLIDGQYHRVTGPGQILDTTAQQLGIDPTDPAQNIDGAARYFSDLVNKNGGNYVAAVQQYKGIKNPDTPKNQTIMQSFQGWVDRFKNETEKGVADAESKGFGRSETGKLLGPGKDRSNDSPSFITRLKTPEFVTFLAIAVVLAIFSLFNLTQTAKQAVSA